MHAMEDSLMDDMKYLLVFLNVMAGALQLSEKKKV
jgi:hypothetical protein